ncbi:MAG: AAA family ATPase [Chitinophagaceae bacterium]|nr:AAA family ATPase [Chitinophagaceae bacterium]
MQLQKAERNRAKIKMAIQGPSGSGKTYSALLLGYGLCNDWTKIAVIDSENHSANLYAHLGKYNVLDIQAPFTPERYIEAIQICEKASMEVIIIDSISHEWEGIGGLLETHGNMAGNSYTNWNKITPRHNSFIQHILQSPVHIIGTIRSKQDYVLSEKNGRMVPEKVGLRGVTREGLDYEFTLVFEIDIKHNCTATKDRTSVFAGKPDFIITPEIGQRILAWCHEPRETKPLDIDNKMLQRINSCKTVEELLQLYKSNPSIQETMLTEFTKKRQLLDVKQDLKTIINQQNISNNGTTNSK